MGLFSRKKKQPEVENNTATETTLSNGDVVMIKQVVDCLGDSCPRPQIMTKKALASANPGDVVEVKIDNPTSMEAIPPMMGELDSSHLETLKADRYWRVLVRKN